MKSPRGFRSRFVSLALVVTLAVPISVWSAVVPLGTARGFGPAKLSVDANKSWLPLGAHAFPILDGAELRSVGGGAVLDLTDGSRIEVFPFSAVKFESSTQAAKVSLLYGRVSFRLPEQTRVEILTPPARLEPVRRGLMVGEVFVSGSGLVGLKMSEGSLQLTEPGVTPRVLLASREPIFLPKQPADQGHFFASDTPLAVPPDAKAIYGPSGRSIGYLSGTDNLVIRPGFTADLTRPFPGKLVRFAMAKIPQADVASDAAMPLFDLNGHYVGYMSGPEFYAQNANQGDQDQGPPEEQKTTKRRGAIAAWAIGGGLAAALGVGLGLAAGGGGGGGGGGGPTPPPASPTTPR
jgi:hypothetical protein